MNSHIHDTVRKLMELHALEDRRNALAERHEKGGEVAAAIESLRAQVPERFLMRHDRLRARGKRSVAELRQGVCSGCHMHVATGLVPILMQHDSLHACEYCGRLLYVLWENSTQTASSSANQPVILIKPRKARAAKSPIELVSH